MKKITGLEAVSKTKFKVYVDGSFAFVLYKGELFRYQIKEGGELSEQIYEEIRQQVVIKRAKLYAMHLLEDMDRTQDQLLRKLRLAGYPEEIAWEALEYVKSFGYVDDLRYARRIVEGRRQSKSRKEIYAYLRNKGLASDLIEKALEECYGDEDGIQAIRDFLRKKRYDPQRATEIERQKMYAVLARKGFRYEDIRQII